MVPAYLHQGTARRQLEQPGHPRGVQEDAAILVRSRHRWIPHRRGARSGQGSGKRAAGRHGSAGRAARPVPRLHEPAVGPPGGARHLPRVARGVQRVRSAALRRRRGLGRSRAPAPVRLGGRARAGVQLRVRQGQLGCGRDARRDHRGPRVRGRDQRIHHHMGDEQPRRAPPRLPLRPAPGPLARSPSARQGLAAARRAKLL